MKPGMSTSIHQQRNRPGRQIQNATLDVVDFAVARALELRNLRDATAASTGTRRVYQQLAWHSRRRTMSHSSHRTPARVRAAHAAQLKKQRPPDTQERPPGPKGALRCRKYRKKARFLKAIRKLRSRNTAWLETHIWHAKRFHMGNVGERHVAMTCNDRGYRSAYRAAIRACIAHDGSYLDIVEIKGTQQNIKAILKMTCGSDSARVMTNPVVRGCRRVSDVVIMDREKTVGPAEVLWRPGSVSSECAIAESSVEDPAKMKIVWLWVQPNLTDDIIKVLKACCFEQTIVQKVLFPPVRFSLYGPRSGAVLASVLRCSDVTFSHVTRARSPNCLPEECITTGNAEDPRASFPPKKMAESVRNISGDGDYGDAFKNVSVSDLWDETEREMWLERISTAGGKPLSEAIPFVLMQHSTMIASGYDLLVPPGTGMAFWNSLMYANGMRAIGLTDQRRFRLENLSLIFPEDFQDGRIGFSLMEAEAAQKQEWYKRRPPSKRVNYTLNRITSPRAADLIGVASAEVKMLGPEKKRLKLEENEGTGMTVHIVRSRKLLEDLLGEELSKQLIFDGLDRKRSYGKVCVSIETESVKQLDSELTNRHCSYFARVRVEPLSRGAPDKNGILCEAEQNDMKGMRLSGRKYRGAREEKYEGRKGNGGPSREVIGYVTSSGWRMCTGRPVGTGYIAISALRRLPMAGSVKGLRQKGGLVMFRNTESPQYQAAVVRVLAPQC